jgi:hypothetical protein
VVSGILRQWHGFFATLRGAPDVLVAMPPRALRAVSIAQSRLALIASLIARFTAGAPMANWGKYHPETALGRGPALSTLAAERRSARVNGHARAAFPLLALTIEVLPAFDARFVM